MNNNLKLSTQVETEEDVLVEERVQQDNNLILYNDNVNTFDFVIETLVDVCKHQLLQAEQCAYLVHYTGKCSVKTGAYTKLEPLCTALLDKGLSAKIE